MTNPSAINSNGSSAFTREIVQAVKWVAVGTCSALSRSLVHFFISTGDITAPYQANCKLTIFGEGIDEQSVHLEGARLSQPDGVRLDQAFACLSGGVSGLVGIEIEVSTTQQRANISNSQCVLEILTGNTSLRYWPKRLERGEEPLAVVKDLMALDDGVNTSSLVAINRSATECSFAIEGGSYKGDSFPKSKNGNDEKISSTLSTLSSDKRNVCIVKPGSVIEVPIRKETTAADRGYCSVDSVAVRPLSGQPPILFLALRDSNSQRLTSIAVV